MEDYDRLCVRSWIACGFRIISLNGREEIAALAARHPEVSFVAAQRDARDAFGRKTPFIADLLALLSRETAPILGIVNSDILFEPVSAWQEIQPLIARKSVVTGQRCDTKTLAVGALHRYLPGFDFFFFDKAAANILVRDAGPFGMGLPWWDYWLPMALALRGYDIRCLARPAVLHLAHESRTEARAPAWRQLALEFARSMVAASEAHTRLSHPEWESLLALCREMGGASETARDQGELDERIIRLSELSVPIIAARIVDLGETTLVNTGSTLAPAAHFFGGLNKRVIAGDALHKALWHEQRGELDVALQFHAAALQHAPLDAGVLISLGHHWSRRGDPKRAVVFLKRAAELAPDSGYVLNSAGATLAELGYSQDAMTYFDRALWVDPLYAPTYYNVVVACYPQPRYRDIIRLLEQRIQEHPDFAEGREWLERIREVLPRLANPPASDMSHASR